MTVYSRDVRHPPPNVQAWIDGYARLCQQHGVMLSSGEARLELVRWRPDLDGLYDEVFLQFNNRRVGEALYNELSRAPGRAKGEA